MFSKEIGQIRWKLEVQGIGLSSETATLEYLFSSGIPELDSLLGGGYIDLTAVLVIGPVGISKEVLLYNFVKSGGLEGDLCLYITNKSTSDVIRDMTMNLISSQCKAISQRR